MLHYRFQKTYQALEQEGQAEKKQLVALHQQRVQADLNERKRHAMEHYMSALQKPTPDVRNSIAAFINCRIRTGIQTRSRIPNPVIHCNVQKMFVLHGLGLKSLLLISFIVQESESEPVPESGNYWLIHTDLLKRELDRDRDKSLHEIMWMFSHCNMSCTCSYTFL